jgi:hypothetical protein
MHAIVGWFGSRATGSYHLDLVAAPEALPRSKAARQVMVAAMWILRVMRIL